MDLDEAEALIGPVVVEAFRRFLARIRATVFADPDNPDVLVWPSGEWPRLVDELIVPGVVEVFVLAGVEAGLTLEQARLAAGTFVSQDLAPVVEATTIPDRTQDLVLAGLIGVGVGAASVLASLSPASALFAPMLGVMTANAAGVAVNAGIYQAATAAADFGRRRVTKRWLAHDDERTRLTHAAIDNKVVLVNDTFNVGGFPLRYPHDPFGPVQEVVNCRCRLRFGVENG